MKKTIYTFYSIRFFEEFIFITPIWSFFFLNYLNFSFGTGLFIMTILSIVSIIFEIPSGAWADRFGRKKMYLLGTILIITHLLIWLISKDIIFFVLSGIIGGIGYATISGNLDALIHDMLKEKNKELEFKDYIANSYFAIFIGRALATSIAGFLFVINPLLPVILTIIPFILIFLLALTLKEPKQVLSQHKNNFSHLKETLHFFKREKNIVFFILILGFLSSIGNIYYFTQQPFYKGIGFNIESIGILFGVGAIFSAFGSYIYKKISNKLEDKQILNIMLFMVLFGGIVFSLNTKIFAIIGLITMSLMFGFLMTFGNNFLIHKTPEHQKSTVLSVFSFTITIGYSFFNIILSLIIDKTGIFNIYLVNIFLIILLIIFNLFTFNKS